MWELSKPGRLSTGENEPVAREKRSVTKRLHEREKDSLEEGGRLELYVAKEGSFLGGLGP
jgi:hypothetical protein